MIDDRTPEAYVELDTFLKGVATKQKVVVPWLVAGLVAIVVGLSILTFALHRSEQKATQERDAAIQARMSAEEAFNDSARTLSGARDALQAGNREKLAELLNVALDEAETKAQAANGEQGVSVPPAQSPQPAKSFVVKTLAQPFEQEVYIQFAGLIDRKDVAALNTALKAAGWRVEGRDGERTGKAAGLNEVRYSADADRPAAEALAQALSEAQLGRGPVRARKVSIIRAGTLEAWISNT